MLKLKDVPNYYIISNHKRSKLGVSKVDYSEYIEVIMEFVKSNKPYMLVEVIDEDPWLSGNTITTRLRTAIDICELKSTIRVGHAEGDGKSHYCLYRRDMGY